MQKTLARTPQREAHQVVRLNIDTKNGASSIRISFTDQRLTAHGWMVVWSHFLHQKRFRQQLREVLPHAPISPNAYDPTDVALGYIGILCRADKLSRELNTLRWRLFSRAAVWSQTQSKSTLKLAVQDKEHRSWWREILNNLTALPNCNAVESLQA